MRNDPNPLLAGLALLLAGCAATGAGDGDAVATRVTLTGIISFAEDGGAWLAPCGSGNRVRLGEMTSGNYRYLQRRVAELEGRAAQPVTAQLSGYLGSTGKTRQMDRPALMWLSAGYCTEPEEPPMDRPVRKG